MIDPDIALSPLAVEPARVAEQQLVHPVVDRLQCPRIGNEDAGDDVGTVEASANDETHLIGVGAFRDQVIGMEEAERADDLELLENLAESCVVSVLRAPFIAERIAVGVDARDPALVDAAVDRRHETCDAVQVELLHASVYWIAECALQGDAELV